jgi:hypothetical protein
MVNSYHNMHVHDVIEGSERKEELQQFIEDQLALGKEELGEKYRYLFEVNLEDLTSTTREEQHYCLLQPQAAWMESALGGTNSGRRTRRPEGRDRA